MKNELVLKVYMNKKNINKIKQHHFKQLKGAFTDIENILNKNEINENEIEELIHLLTYLRYFSLNFKDEILENIKTKYVKEK